MLIINFYKGFFIDVKSLKEYKAQGGLATSFAFTCYLQDNSKKIVITIKKLISNSITVSYNNQEQQLNTNDFAGAIADFDAALKQKPNYTLAMNNMASAYIKKKDYKSATEWANKAIQADAKLAAAYVNRGIAKQMLKDEEGACADWKKAAEYGTAEGKRYTSGFCD